MSRHLFKVSSAEYPGLTRVLFWCPGCEDVHAIDPGVWQWDPATLTASPSILVCGTQWPPGDDFHRPRHSDVPPGGATTCHSFLRNGLWEFLTDSTHALSGQTVPMEPLPHWLQSGEPSPKDGA
jgi:hypothetical protein